MDQAPETPEPTPEPTPEQKRRARRELAVARQERAWRLRTVYCKGLAEIAADLGISKQATWKALTKATARAKERLDKEIASTILRQARQIEYAIGSLMAQWDRSCEAAVTVRRKKSSAGIEKSSESKAQSGNPALLAEARNHRDELRRLLGVTSAAPETGTPAVGGETYIGILARLERDLGDTPGEGASTP
jgi:hypothetical protein